MRQEIRLFRADEGSAILEIINDAAEAYRGVIPPECWHEPYMSMAELVGELAEEVVFWVLEQDNELMGVMGLQDKGGVDLIRHAYVRTRHRRQGIGSELLRRVEAQSEKPILIGTWAAATWAIDFYRAHGYQVTSDAVKTALLHRYWTVPEQQMATSVVLVKGDLASV
jgi:N-acetylglutamate synthase-like GNAT family acetyltransferase